MEGWKYALESSLATTFLLPNFLSSSVCWEKRQKETTFNGFGYGITESNPLYLHPLSRGIAVQTPHEASLKKNQKNIWRIKKTPYLCSRFKRKSLGDETKRYDHWQYWISAKKEKRVNYLSWGKRTCKETNNFFYNEEFDPGSGWTLATGLTHASRGAA